MILFHCDTFYHKSVVVASVLAQMEISIAERDWAQFHSPKNLSKSTKGLPSSREHPFESLVM